MPPRLRGFLLPGVDWPDVRIAFDGCAARAWTGRSMDRATLLSVATRVYNEAADAAPAVRSGRRSARRVELDL